MILSRIARPDDSHLLECIYQPQWQKTITTPHQWQCDLENIKRRWVCAPSPAIHCCLRSVRSVCCCCCCIRLRHTILVYTVYDCWKTLHAVIHFARFWLLILLRYSVRSHTLKTGRYRFVCARENRTLRFEILRLKFILYGLVSSHIVYATYRTYECRYECVRVSVHVFLFVACSWLLLRGFCCSSLSVFFLSHFCRSFSFCTLISFAMDVLLPSKILSSRII